MIQDESFPDDEFLDELNFSTNAGIRFQFPHHNQLHRQQRIGNDLKPTPSTSTTNTSSSSTDQNISGESTNGRSSSALSSKTTASDPTGLADKDSKKPDYQCNEKAISYQDIHSQYVKRRYKHVESKVGQYIASMKAEDQKRKNSAKFQRHRSLPDTLVASNASPSKRTSIRLSVAELQKLEESTSEAEADSSENTTGTASTSSMRTRHKSSDDTGAAVQFMNKMAYAQLMSEMERIQSFNDYLQTKLDEKIGDNIRLKRNVDIMRIELSNCMDKLKKQPIGGGMCNSMGRHSLQALLYCEVTGNKATQTDILPLPPPPPLYNTPDANNNKSKSSNNVVANMQPISLNFSHIAEQDSGEGGNNRIEVPCQHSVSNGSTQAVQPLVANCSKHNSHSSCRSSSGDSAIDIESTGLVSPKPHLRKVVLPPPTETQTSQAYRAEYMYYDKNTRRYAALAELSTSNADDENFVAGASGTTHRPDANNKATKKYNSLRKRWLRIFGPCAGCKDPNQTLNASIATQQTYTQIPLLEKSLENHCRNFR